MARHRKPAVPVGKIALIGIIIIGILSVSFYLFYMRPRYVVPILMYHSIADTEAAPTPTVKIDIFARQMKFLNDNYSVISLDELVNGIKKGVKFSRKTVVVTFDDGYNDNYLNAFPVLVKYNVPAIIFLNTGLMSSPENDRLTWDQVRIMMEHNVDFGGHTRNSIYLPSVKDTRRLWDEIAGCRGDIKEHTGKDAEYFAYPTGGFNEKIKECVKKAGYKGACTTNRGYDRSNRDVYELNRIKVTNSDMVKPFHFRAKLSGYYNLFRSFKNGE